MNRGIIMNKALIILMLLGATTLSHANRWLEIRNEGDSKIEIDLETLQNIGTPSKPIAKAWIRYISLVDNNPILHLNSGGAHVFLKQYDCSNNVVRTYISLTYDGQNNLLASKEHPTPRNDEIIPTTTGETIFKSMCTIIKTKNPI